MVVLAPLQLPCYVAASSAEVDRVIEKLGWWPHRLICKSDWHVGPCKLPVSLRLRVCSFLPPPNLLRQVGRHLRDARGGESIVRRTYAIIHACLQALWSRDERYRVDQDWRGGVEKVLRYNIKSVMVVRYASRSHRDYPTHVAEIMGQLVDGRYFHYQDMHPNMDWPLTSACSWADVDSYLESMQFPDDCFVLTLGPDLLTVLRQLDHRSLQNLVTRPEAGQYTDGPCGCLTCRMDAAIEKFGIQDQVQMFAVLQDLRDDLQSLYLEVWNQQDDENDSASDHYGHDYSEHGSWMPQHCSKKIAWALELVEKQQMNSDCVCGNDLLDIWHGLQGVLYASDADDVGELRRNTPAFEAVKTAYSELMQFLFCPFTWQSVSIDSLSFTEASCPSVFLEGPRAGQPLALLVEQLKTGDAVLSEFAFNVIKLEGNTYVLGKQCELWCLKEYMLWASRQQPAVDVETVEVTVWPLVPSIKFNHGDIDPLQHFLELFSTTCAGVSIDLLEPTPEQMATIFSLAGTGTPDDLQDESEKLVCDIKLVEELWTLVSSLEGQMASAVGKEALVKVRRCLCELQNAHDPHEKSIPQADNENMQTDILQKSDEDSVDQDKRMPRELAATVDPEEAANIVEACWVSPIEARIAAENSFGSGSVVQQHCMSGSLAPPQVHPNGSLIVLCFKRHPGAFDTALIDSPLAQELVGRGVDVHPVWANGAKVLAEGVDPFVLDEARVIPAPWHVIVREHHEHEVYKTLRALPHEIRPKLKRGREKIFVHDSDLEHAQLRSLSPRSSCSLSAQSFELQSDPTSSSENVPPVERLVLIRRTFIHVEGRQEQIPKSARTC